MAVNCLITIPIEPRTKKNSQRIIKTGNYYRILPSKAYKLYEQKCRDYIPDLHISTPVNIQARYYMGTHRRVDLCNLHEALCDILAVYGCLEDDNAEIVASMDGSRVFYDKENPRTEILITDAEA